MTKNSYNNCSCFFFRCFAKGFSEFKPLKYPLMYESCDLLIVNKVDVTEYFDFDQEKVVEYAKMRNHNIDVIFISATKGKGVGTLAEWIFEKTREWNE